MKSVTLPVTPSVGLSGATGGAAALGAAGIVGASSRGAPTCLFHAVTGLPCPFCGLTHGVAELGAGHLATAVALNPLAPLAVALALTVPIALLRGRPPVLTRSVATGLVAIVLVAWIVRLAA